MAHDDGSSSSTGGFVAAVVAAALVVAAVWFFFGRESDDAEQAGPPPEDLGDCTLVTVAASPEKAGVLDAVASAYNAENPEVDGNCVWVQVDSKGSGTAADALVQGWDASVDGPEPVIWSPASSAWGEIANERSRAADRASVVPADFTSVAASPLVIAMPRPMAEALGWPEETLGWQDLADLASNNRGWGSVGHPEWGAFKLGKTNPNISTSGLNATIGLYFAGTGVSSDLTVAQVNDPATQEFVGGVESAVVHYGDTTLTFLENLLAADRDGVGLSYISAVTVEEKSVLDYNAGNPAADPNLTDLQPPSTPLVAVYPEEGTLASDNPFFVLDAPWVTDAQASAAADFTEYALSEPAQQEFLDDGFRGADGSAGPSISQENGLLPDEPSLLLGTPGGEVLAAITEGWHEVRKPAAVLMVLDVSGSMAADVEGSGASRLELAQQATTAAVTDLESQDAVGLWAFSDELVHGANPWTELVEVSDVEAAVPAIEEIVPRLLPDGGTALYATTRAAHDVMSEQDTEGAIVGVVLLTDGVNEHSDNDLDSLLEQLESEGTSTGVRVFTIGYGEDADQATLTAIAEASRARSYDVSDPTTIDRVMVDVLSNF